jgi:hypothetical protein
MIRGSGAQSATGQQQRQVIYQTRPNFWRFSYLQSVSIFIQSGEWANLEGK